MTAEATIPALKRHEAERLRTLAREVAEIAHLPQQEENRRLWTAVNDLRMIRPVLHTRDYPVYLMEYGDELTLTIEDEFYKAVELDLLMRIYEWKHLRCDRVISPVVRCPVAVTDTGFGIKAYTGLSGGINTDSSKVYEHAAHFEPQIKTEADLDLIKTPVVNYDEKTTMERLGQMKGVFDGILEVKLFGRCHWRIVPWDDILTWTGINEGMYKFALEPELMHAAMRRYMDAAVAQVKQYEDLGIVSSNNSFDNIGNNDPGFTSQLPPPPESGIGAKLKDIWGANADQIMTAVSPEMQDEFAFAYEKEYAEMFGLFGYGCCERLDNKLDILTAAFPNLRKISCSPYSEVEPFMEQAGNRYVTCFKTNSNYLVTDRMDEDYLRKELIHVIDLARKYDANLVINMKTIISLRDEPQRLWRWCDMARDIVANY